jgi:hypothetical protein
MGSLVVAGIVLSPATIALVTSIIVLTVGLYQLESSCDP